MTVVGPLLCAGQINSGFTEAEGQYQALTSIAAWGAFKRATWFAFCCISALSIYGGLGLAQGRDWSVVKRAKVILWITGPAATLLMGLVIPAMSFGNIDAADGQILGPFIASVMVAALWTGYLSKSKRVRNTYG